MEKQKVIFSKEELDAFAGEDNSLQNKVYNALIEKFLNKELVPGQIINRRQVASEMDVSVAPVLEAFLRLEQEGFVLTIPRKGTMVSPLRKEDIIGYAVIREAIEVEAAFFYRGEKIRDNYDELHSYAELLDSTPIHSVEHADMETIFHASLVNLSGYRTLLQDFLRVNRVGYFYKINTMRTDIGTQSQKHVDLIDSLCTDDAFKAVEAVRSHLRSGKPWSEEVFRL